MALIKCPECGREKVSSKAEACPNCGFPISESFAFEYPNVYIQTEANYSEPQIQEINTPELKLTWDQKYNNKNKLTWDQKYNNKPKNSNTNIIPVVIIICCIFLLGFGYLNYQSTRCRVPGCDNKRMSSSDYCINHYLKANKNYSLGDSYSTYSISSEKEGTQGAVDRAKSYLRSSAFSYLGLIKQLEFEGFSETEATYGVDNCGADWYEQAEKKAKSYLSSSSFSYTGLIEQLEFEGFTESEATYGVDNCGADWYEQAVKKAKSYRRSSHLVGTELKNQLLFEGFTSEQADYGTNNSD